MTTTLSRGPSVARSEPDLVAIYADRARRLGLPFVAEVVLAPGSLPDPAAIEAARFARSAGSDGAAFIAPAESAMPDVARWLAAYPAARDRLSVATPSAIRTGLIEAGRSVFVARAVRKLASAHPDLSASRVATGPQVLVGAISALALAIAVYLDPGPALVAINLLAAFFFFGVSILRLIAAALATPPADDEEEAAPILGESDELPVYTILVPLLREAHLVGDLVAALDQIDWPRGLLDIKLIVEADDPATIDAARIFAARPPYEVIVVPVASPRTKPKALAFALPFARGEFVTVYDAEDQPHPQQLRQAHAVFARSDPELACLQSALVVDNRDSSLLARLFAIEYAALFDGLLPALTALDMPLPLGGTSNHFRREALEQVGGWDPFNVTEDADLGIRLARFGYRSAAIDLPTLEEAPDRLKPWINQRTRWFKGWMQTWLVHTRSPLRLARELGWRGLVGFNLIGTGLIVSALIHPVYLLTILVAATNPLQLWGDGSPFAAMIVGVNLFNLFAGYAAMGALGVRSLKLRDHGRDAVALFALPFYWLAMSWASYRALLHLVLRPHHWDKTPHRGRDPAR